MKLKIVSVGRYEVLAVCKNRGDCPLMEFIDSLDKSMEDYGDKLLYLMDSMAHKGKPENPDVCHLIVQQEHIWQIRAGKLRAPFFMDEPGKFIFTHGFIKKNQKTPKIEKKS